MYRHVSLCAMLYIGVSCLYLCAMLYIGVSCLYMCAMLYIGVSCLYMCAMLYIGVSCLYMCAMPITLSPVASTEPRQTQTLSDTAKNSYMQ
jgi:hypothetical protein